MRRLILFICVNVIPFVSFTQDSTLITTYTEILEQIEKVPVIKDTTYLITPENLHALNLPGTSSYTTLQFFQPVQSPYTLLAVLIGDSLISAPNPLPDTLNELFLNKTCHIQYHGRYHIKITTQEETSSTFYYRSRYPKLNDQETMMVLPHDCNPMEFYAIENKIQALNQQIKNMQQSSYIHSGGRYILLYGTEYHEEIYQFECKYYGDNSEIYTGRELKSLTNQIDGTIWCYDNEYVVIHQSYNYIGAINRWHIVRLYFKRIDN